MFSQNAGRACDATPDPYLDLRGPLRRREERAGKGQMGEERRGIIPPIPGSATAVCTVSTLTTEKPDTLYSRRRQLRSSAKN